MITEMLEENSVKAYNTTTPTLFMHGTDGHTPGRVYTEGTLRQLGLPVAGSLGEAADHIETRNFAYTPLRVLSPVLHDMINLRPILGLRSPVHSFSRMLNPFAAPTMMQGIFHRGFMDIHSGAARILNQPRMAVFRGEGGEIERRPNKPTIVWSTEGDTEPLVETWPALLSDAHQATDQEMDISNLIAVWRGDEENAYATASITGTLAITLKTMGRVKTIEAAEEQAQEIWAARDKAYLPLKD